MRGNRKDACHNLLTNEFVARGATVHDLSRQTKQLDAKIGFRGVDAWVEFKNPKGSPSQKRLTPAEAEIFENWRGRKPEIIETVADVEDLLRRMAAESLAIHRARIARN